MYISNLSIRNFRNFRNVSLDFQQGVNTIIGENGSGKTNLLFALRLLIDESLPRGIKLYESDFNRFVQPWRGHWIIIQIRFSELSNEEESQAIAMHKVGSMDEYDSTTGSYSLIFRPNDVKRKELFDYSEEDDKDEAGLAAILDNITLDDYELTFRGRGNVDFSIDGNYTTFVGDFQDIVFPDPYELREDVYGAKLKGFTIPNELSCTFIKALRDVEADLRSYRDNPLLNLLRGEEKSISVTEKQSIIDKVNDLNDEITALDEIKGVSKGVSESIRQAVGETYAPNIEIKSEVPSEIESLLQSLKLWVGDPDEIGHKGRIKELSLGGANLIYFSLKLLEYEKVKSQNKIANFLLIEEPESHIHTHIQKTLFQKLHAHNTQIIITTHSTHISSVSQISSVNVLSRSNKTAEVFSPSNNLDPSQITALERYLDAVRTNLLFAKGILLVEGDAEQIMIPELVKKVFGVSLDEIGISLINIGSTGFQNVAILFHDDRIRKKCAIITDLDSSILDLKPDPKLDSPEEKDCRNSQISGIQRQVLLDAFCNGNNWLKPFYGKYTFEVDFLKADNAFEVKQTIEKKYTQKAAIERSKVLIEDSNISISGKEILRLANDSGKGWFAIMLSENLTHLSYIPKHILNAIAYSSPHITPQTLVSIAHYRFSNLKIAAFSGNTTDYTDLYEQFKLIQDNELALDFFKTNLPDDILTKFIEILHQ
jgi:predicted ATP-dependent endonuclease of OLD family